METLEKIILCNKFFSALEDLLRGTYETIGSSNMDMSRYLVPTGTSDQITYYSKPDKSFRISDHWSWYSNLKKCSNPKYIQCLNADLPWVKPRIDDKATKPIKAYQVALIGPDGKYHAVYGEVYKKNKHKWEWIEADPKDVAELVLNMGGN